MSTWIFCDRLLAAPCLVVGIPLTQQAELRSDAAVRAEKADYRLPGDVIPSNYKVTLQPYFEGDKAFTFDGEVVITATPDFTVNAEIKELKLHLHKDITVTGVTVKYGIGSLTATPQTEAVGDSEIYTITLGTAITSQEGVDPTNQLLIEIDYTGILNDDMRGFYRSWYNESGVVTWLATTHMEPTAARRAFPCFDEPGMRATFQATVIAPQGYTARANTEATSTAPMADGSTQYTFAQTPKMSTYLFAVIVSKFNETTSADDDSHNLWSRPSATEQRKYAASISPALLQAMENYTSINYSESTITKMDQLSIPDFSAGAMENWGLVTYRERRILVDERETPTSYRKSVANVISHEYAHQWFGDLVGPSWWNVLWLNEGFATFFEYFNTHAVETEWRLDEQFVLDELQLGLSADCRLSTRAMTPQEDAVLTQAQISDQFDNIAYAKAGSVLRMIEHILGTEVWKKGLNKYLTKMKFEAAMQDDLLTSLVEAATEANLSFGGNNLLDILHSWTNNAGYPVLRVTRDREANTATVTQSRFLLTEETTDTPQWIVPLTWAMTVDQLENTSPQQWLKAGATVTLQDVPGDGWLLLNNQRTGFYRVLYEADAWAQVSSALQQNASALPVLTQAQLVDDAFWLARAGLLDYGVALDTTLHLAQVDDYVPWSAALGVLSYLKDRLYGGDHYGNFKTYMLELLSPLYEKFKNFEVSSEMSHTDRLLMEKVLTWVCELGDTSCQEKAAEIFGDITGDGSSSVAADVRSVVYCNGVRRGSADDWQRLWEHYLATNVASEKTLVIAALGCSSNVTVLEEYLATTSDGSMDIRSQDYSAVYSAVYSNPTGYQAAINYVTNNKGVSGASTILAGLASKVTSQDHVQKLVEVATAAELSASAIASLEQSTAEHVQWNQRYEAVVGAWLAARVETPTTTADPGSGATPVVATGSAAALLLSLLLLSLFAA
ncbi:aminopeptidase N-like [Schistocerca cancellata]|uniref:aminopeptidase N-like n=1 Tax=Schistocerca cancellata TaxID=274614 RepID=UPI0021181A62|nr:aminopeptidase N-like [Schistocerca cancellata]